MHQFAKQGYFHDKRTSCLLKIAAFLSKSSSKVFAAPAVGMNCYHFSLNTLGLPWRIFFSIFDLAIYLTIVVRYKKLI